MGCHAQHVRYGVSAGLACGEPWAVPQAHGACSSPGASTSSSAAGPEGAIPPVLRAAGAWGGPCYPEGSWSRLCWAGV